MLCVFITSPDLESQRRQQDQVIKLLGDEAISPIVWVMPLAIRTHEKITIFSSRYMEQLVKQEGVDFVLCDDPVTEACERTGY